MSLQTVAYHSTIKILSPPEATEEISPNRNTIKSAEVELLLGRKDGSTLLYHASLPSLPAILYAFRVT